MSARAESMHPQDRRRPGFRLSTLIGAIDAGLDVVEKAAWDVRALARSASSQAARIAADVEADWRQLERDVRELGSELGAWPARAQRAADTGLMLARVAATYRLHPTRAAFLSEEAGRVALEELHLRNARRFAETSARHGGGMLKVAQLLSARPDLLPPAWVEACAPLQDDAPAVPSEQVRAHLEAELGGRVEDHFQRFDDTPVAAASIGQVHRAVTHAGEDVAVKVTRPDIHARLEIDLDLLELFLEMLQSQLPPADYPTIASELREMLWLELDYRSEARMMERVRAFLSGRDEWIVPETLPALCSRDVLVSRFVEGRKITHVLDDLKHAREAGDEHAAGRLDRILELLLEAMVRQILVAGLFQADPHPGNFLVTADDRLVLLDFGCTRELDPATRDAYLELIGAFLSGNGGRVAELLGELGFRTRSGDPGTLVAFAELLMGEFRDSMLKRDPLDPQAMVARASHVLERAQADPVVHIPAEFVMLARVFLALGGMFRHYAPRIDFARPVLAVLAERRG